MTTRVKPWRSSFSLINLMRVITLQGWLMRLPTRLISMIAHVLWHLVRSGNSVSELRMHVARLRAVANKEHREAAEQSKKRPRVKEVEEEVDMTVEHCKQCIVKGMLSL